MILYIFGADTFRSRQYLKKTIEQFKKQRDPQGYNTVILDAKKIEDNKIFNEIFSAPFLADKKMIVIENILSSGDKELLGQIIDNLKNKKFPENNVVVFYQDEFLGKVKEAKELNAALSKEKYAQEFALLAGPQLSAWAQREIQIRGGMVTNDALQFLCQNSASDVWHLNTMIDQLVAYRLGAQITLPDVQLFLNEKIDDSAFNMVDAIVAGNHKIAFKLLEEQRRLGEDDMKIFGLILWQFRIILEIADLLANEPNATSDTAAKLIGIHPFVARKNFAVAKKYSLARLQHLYQELLNIDIKTKTGKADQSLLIDMFVAKV